MVNLSEYDRIDLVVAALVIFPAMAGYLVAGGSLGGAGAMFAAFLFAVGVIEAGSQLIAGTSLRAAT